MTKQTHQTRIQYIPTIEACWATGGKEIPATFYVSYLSPGLGWFHLGEFATYDEARAAADRFPQR